MNPPELDFGKPTFFERLSNKGFGASAGLGLAHNYLLEVRGRKTDRGVFDPRGRAGVNGKHFLVAPRGRTQLLRLQARSLWKNASDAEDSKFGSFQMMYDRKKTAPLS
jgi:hypothetical protein